MIPCPTCGGPLPDACPGCGTARNKWPDPNRKATYCTARCQSAAGTRRYRAKKGVTK